MKVTSVVNLIGILLAIFLASLVVILFAMLLLMLVVVIFPITLREHLGRGWLWWW